MPLDDAIAAKTKWSSSNADVAAINATGDVTALKEGTAVITATVDGTQLSDSIQITVERSGSGGGRGSSWKGGLQTEPKATEQSSSLPENS